MKIHILLPFENGILELKTGELRETTPEENIFLTTGYDFNKTNEETALILFKENV